jgi:hypothetical protein
VTEDSAALRKRMDELEETIKDRERECATLTDENHRLKTPPAAPKKPKLIAFPWLRDED